MQQHNSNTDLLLLLRERVPENPIVVVTKHPDFANHALILQDYIIGGESIIPVFSSTAALRASTQGADLGLPLFEIDRAIFVSIAKSEQVYLLDPQTTEQVRFTGIDIRLAFSDQ